MKKILLLLLISIPGLLNAQIVQELSFVEETHDFGLIKEAAGPAEFKFEYTNSADKPITITNVRASCGCTTPAWTREPVLPGEKGFITAVYNPKNRPGPFNKTLTVTTNGKKSTLVLRIQGKVEPKPRTIQDDFPTEMGALRTKYRAFNMGKIYNNEPTRKQFVVYNQGVKDITFMSEVNSPGYIRVSFDPQVLGPNQKGNVIITYDSKVKNDLGFSSDLITFYTSEAEPDNKKEYTVYADLNEYFEPLTPETASAAPKLAIGQRVHEFGKINQGEVVTTSYSLTNEGKSPLNIRKVSSNCTCVVANLKKQNLQPGETVNLEVSFNSAGRRGTQQKSITLYSSDPVTPVQRLIIKASVQVQSN